MSTLATRGVEDVDNYVGVAKNGTSRVLNHLFPDHWSFFLGEIALYSFMTLIVTGVFLALYYVPSLGAVTYRGPYHPLDGQKVSEAYQSVLSISFQVRAGLLMRQMHHWAADIFIGAICVHMARIFFTGAYRRPRSPNWVIGLTMLILAVFNGYFGYSLPDDLLSGAGVRIGYSIIESIPFVGSYFAFFAFDGNFPGQQYLYRFFILHVFVLPGAIAILLAVHLFLVFHQEHTQFPGKHQREDNVIGSPLWPNFVAKTSGLLLMVVGTLAILGSIAQIDPIWQLGPFDPYKVSYASQPDWYMGWLEGALRMMPSWQWFGWGHTIPWVSFLPGVVFPLVTFVFLYAWPWIERAFTGDNSVHNLVTPPRDRPRHTAFGAGFVAFLVMTLVDGGDDVLANFLHLDLQAMVWALRVATFAVPLVVALLTMRICQNLPDLPPLRDPDRRLRVRLEQGRFYSSEVEQLPPPSDGKAEEPIEVPNYVTGTASVHVDH